MARARLAAGMLVALVAAAGRAAAADVPDTATLLGDLGFSSDAIQEVRSGSLVMTRIEPSSERELVVAFAFRVKPTPAELIDKMRAGVFDRMVANSSVYPVIEPTPSLASFAQLTLGPDAQKRAQTYENAHPGRDLNLSSDEISRFDALRGSSPSAIEQAMQSALLARLEAYRARGLAGIDPYARSDGRLLFPGDELRSATLATKKLQALQPAAFRHLLDYPASKPPGTEEDFRWSESSVYDVPTLTLTHRLAIPDGGAWVVAQRQFYVSTGYNCEQSIARYLPMQGGTLVIYTNRASTDEVLGFAGGVKREIGNKLLAWRLEGLYGRIQASLQ
jgi:hypothetical protein